MLPSGRQFLLSIKPVRSSRNLAIHCEQLLALATRYILKNHRTNLYTAFTASAPFASFSASLPSRSFFDPDGFGSLAIHS